MSVTRTWHNGRFCNQLIRNLCVSLIAKCNDLKVEYSSNDRMQRLGLILFSGNKSYSHYIELNDENFMSILNAKEICANLEPNCAFFQTEQISSFLYRVLRIDAFRESIIAANPFKARYGTNNDCFVHIRLTDLADVNQGIGYYKQAILQHPHDNLWIASDDFSHPLIKELCEVYPKADLVLKDEVETIQFGSTCKHLVLSLGSYSAIVGYLGYNTETVLYPGDADYHKSMFTCIPLWKSL